MRDPDPWITRAHEEIAAAWVLHEAGFAAQAVSRAYYGAFYAAEAALLHVGETRSKHSGVIAAFVQLVVLDAGCDEQAGRLLRDLFERRGQADYSADPVPVDEGERAAVDAATVVTLIEAWIAGGS